MLHVEINRINCFAFLCPKMQSGDFAFVVGWKGVFETMFSEKMKKIDDVVFFLSKKNENAKNGKKLVNPFRRSQKQSWNLQIMILYHFLMWLNNRKKNFEKASILHHLATLQSPIPTCFQRGQKTVDSVDFYRFFEKK